MINWQVIGQLFSAALIVLSGPIVILLISLKK
ncbi:MAG: photosystem II reaction center protein Ycf12 [Cyanobacteria bacterium J06629_18]